MALEVPKNTDTSIPPSKRLDDLKFIQSHIVLKSKSWLYARISESMFPPPIKMGRSSLWVRSWLLDWVEAAKNGEIEAFMQDHLANRQDLNK